MTMKEPATEEISSAEYFLAQGRWIIFWNNTEKEPQPAFNKFLDMTGTWSRSIANLDFKMRIERNAARKIKQLCSPHWYAILMAYKIRKYGDD